MMSALMHSDRLGYMGLGMKKLTFEERQAPRNHVLVK